jgi:DNA polymerase-3 subunit delta
MDRPIFFDQSSNRETGTLTALKFFVCFVYFVCFVIFLILLLIRNLFLTMKRQASGDALKSQSDFFRNLENKKIAPVYLFDGSENFQRDQALNKLLDAAVDQSVRQFNHAVISVAGGDLGEALGLARQYPMISEKRMVVVTGFEAISDDNQLEMLKDYLRDPAETTVLVFVTSGLDNRRNIATILKKGCETVSFEPLDEREGAPEWIRQYVGGAGCSIDLASASYLTGMVGVSMMTLSNELDKLMAYIGFKGRITRTEIDEVVRHSREHSSFELTDAIIDGDRKRALTLLDLIFANPTESTQTLSLMILGAIASNYRRMLMAKDLMRQNAPNSEVAKAVGMSPYGVTKFNERIRKIDTERIIRGIERISRTDLALKTSLATPRLQLELLISELCPVKPQTR